MNDLKYCRDCKHILIDGEIRYAKCGHELAQMVKTEALVTGNGDPIERLYCATMRTDICGKEAKLFEPASIRVVAGSE